MKRHTARVVALLIAGILLPLSVAAQGTVPPLADSGVHQDSYWYGQFGAGSLADGLRYRSPLIAFGIRREHDHRAIDLQLFSGQFAVRSPDLHTYGGIYTDVFSGSLMTVQVLDVLRPDASKTLYVGGGAGLSGVSFGRWGDVDDEWSGRGLEGRATVGYAFRRADTSTRWFIEAGLRVPAYAVRRSTRKGAPAGTRRIYPLAIALGVGW